MVYRSRNTLLDPHVLDVMGWRNLRVILRCKGQRPPFKLDLLLLDLTIYILTHGSGNVRPRALLYVSVLQDETTEINQHQTSHRALMTAQGVCFIKGYHVTVKMYRNSYAKIEDSKMHILLCMGSKFRMKFQRVHLNFHTNFELIHHKTSILRWVKDLPTYDIFELWYLKR